MLTKTLKFASVLSFALSATVYSQFLPYYHSMPKVSAPYDSILSKTWQGIKKRNIDPYTTGMVHRPRSEYPNDAVSEGISYAMFLALYTNDQTYFNRVWNGAERYMLYHDNSNNRSLYNWWRNAQGGESGAGPAFKNGPASDADPDIALLLIFANRLVQRGIWNNYSANGSGSNVTYAQRAQGLLNNIRENLVGGGRYLLAWQGAGLDVINPSYFAPAFYRVFAEFDPANKTAWENLIDGSYDVVKRSPGYERGLVPDWCNNEGGPPGGLGYNAYLGGNALYMDAIRIYWRLGIDYLWYGEPRAKEFLDNGIKFIGTPAGANFYQMNGELLPITHMDTINGEGGVRVERPRRMHNHLTVGMWSIAAMASGGAELAESYSDYFLSRFYEDGNDFFTIVNNPPSEFDRTTGEWNDVIYSDMYYDQFLGWFSAAVFGGVFTNVWEDLKDGVPTGPPAWVNRPKVLLDNWDINASAAPFTLGEADASFNRSLPWTVTFTHQTTGETRAFSNTSNAVDVTWYGLNESGGYMPQGWYTVTISSSASGLTPSSFTREVWLGRPYANTPNLRVGNRLLIDDFNDRDLVPYIGAEWRTYTEGSGSTGTFSFGSQGNNHWMNWNYVIGTGDYPLSALVWSAGANTIDFSGIDSIIIVARTTSGTLGTSFQLLSTDFAPNEWQYFGHSVQLTTSWQTIGMAVANFQQRGDGSGKNINASLANLTGLRFHMQSDLPEAPPAAGTVQLDAVYISGTNNVLSRIYTPPASPPEYMPPTREPVGITHRIARTSERYSIKRSGTQFILTMPADMAGADVRIVNVKGVVVKRTTVPKSGQLAVSARDLAKGMYFVDVKKAGTANVRMPLGNVK